MGTTEFGTSHRQRRTANRLVAATGVGLLVILSSGVATAHERPDLSGTTTVLVANRTGLGAAKVDPNLLNPWGLSKLPTSPVWISDNHANVSTLALGGTAAVPAGVTVPPLVVTVPGGPTGQIANATTGFKLSNGSPAVFVFANEEGELWGWNRAAGTTAERTAQVAGGNFKGLAQTSVAGASYLLGANFTLGRIDVFDSTWQSASWPGAFSVRHLPKGFSPFNVQTLRDASGADHVFVAYALRDPVTNDEVAGRRLGLVAEFTPDGKFIRRFERNGMNAPWGLALAPASWGAHAGELLVGQFGNGQVEMYDARDGDHSGTLSDGDGHPIVIDGLWALLAGDATSGGVGSVLFTAGPNEEADGIYGIITVSERNGDGDGDGDSDGGHSD